MINKFKIDSVLILSGYYQPSYFDNDSTPGHLKSGPTGSSIGAGLGGKLFFETSNFDS